MSGETHDNASRPAPSRVAVALILLLALAYVLVCLFVLPAGPFFERDSLSYVRFDPTRTAGYPLFLALVGVKGATALQPILYAAAASLLGVQSLRVGRAPLFAVGLVVLLFINPRVNEFHAKILTESLFVTLVAGMLGMLVQFAWRPGWKAMAAAGVLGGFVAIVRPTGIALLPVLVIAALLKRHETRGRNLAVLTAALLPFLAIVGTEHVYTRAVHGAAATSFLGPFLFAKAAMIDAPPAPVPVRDPTRRLFVSALENDFAPIRALLHEAPTANIRTPLAVYYENCLQYDCTVALRDESGLSGPAIDALELRVGLDRLARAPLEYVRLTLTHYRAMWLLYSQSHPALAPAFTAFIAAHRPLPFQDLVPELGNDVQPVRSALFVRPAVALVGAVTLCLALVGLVACLIRRRLSPPFVAAALSALATHGLILFSAMFSVGVPRFTLSTWPAMMMALVYAASGLRDVGQAFKARRADDGRRSPTSIS